MHLIVSTSNEYTVEDSEVLALPGGLRLSFEPDRKSYGICLGMCTAWLQAAKAGSSLATPPDVEESKGFQKLQPSSAEERARANVLERICQTAGLTIRVTWPLLEYQRSSLAQMIRNMSLGAYVGVSSKDGETAHMMAAARGDGGIYFLDPNDGIYYEGDEARFLHSVLKLFGPYDDLTYAQCVLVN